MRTNATKKCAVGAMLVGGSLGLTQAASAGLTWIGESVAGQSWISPTVGEEYGNGQRGGSADDWQGSNAFAANTWSYGSGNEPPEFLPPSVTYSGTNSAGSWMLSSNVPNMVPPGYPATYNFFSATYGQLFFEVTGTQQVTISTYMGLQGANWEIRKYDAEYNDVLFQSFSVGNDGDSPAPLDSSSVNYVTLSAGIYKLDFGATVYGRNNPSGFDGNTIGFTVPAPGAVALLGMAGLAGRRRRS